MATEYEWKFRCTPSTLRAIDAAFCAPSQVIAMETTYFDTPSGAFSARHFTLRTRLENGVSVCTLKTPSGNARNEWEVESSSITEAIAHFLASGCPQEVASLAQEGLIPVCGARFTRTAKTICQPEGTLELAMDSGILFSGDRQIPLCEVELELKDGTAAFCDWFAAAFAAQFQLEVEPKSKFARARALQKGE